MIPLQPRGKRPLVKWENYQKCLATIDEVERWWNENPDANIGIVMGKISGLVAVDIDNRGGNTYDAMYEIDEKYPGMVQQTGSGGFHVIYQWQKPTKNATNIHGKTGIDIRGDGGYIVMAPSVHQNGTPYTWYETRDFTLNPPPEWIYPKSASGAGPKYADQVDSSGQPIQEQRGADQQGWITDILSGTVEGSRNDSCARLAGYYAKKAMPRDVVIALMHQWNANNTPSLPPPELERTVESVFNKEVERNPLKFTKEGKPKPDPRDDETEKDRDKPAFTVTPFVNYMRKHGGKAVEWLIDEWLPLNTIGLMVSPPGAGKTWTIMDLAVSIAGGVPFFGQFEVRQPGPVILIQQEDHHGATTERIGTIAKDRFGFGFESKSKKEDGWSFNAPPDIPIYVHEDRLLHFADARSVRELGDVIEDIRPRLVILDPLYSAATTADFMAQTAEQMMALKRYRDNFDCGFLIAHHTRKSSKDASQGREAAWGSQFLNAFLETGIQLRPLDDDYVSILRHSKVAPPFPQLRAKWDICTTGLDAHYSIELDLDNPDGTGAGSDPLLVTLVGCQLTSSEIAEKSGVHRTTVTRRMAKLKNEGLVNKHGQKWYLPVKQTETELDI